MIESAHSSILEPDNTDVVEHMKNNIRDIEHTPTGTALDPDDSYPDDTDYDGLSQS